MDELAEYFFNRWPDAIREQYGANFGEVLQYHYKILIHYVEVEQATKLVIDRVKGLKLYRGDEVIRDTAASLELQLSKIEDESHRQEILDVRQHVTASNFYFFPLIIKTDEMMQRYMRLMVDTEDRIEIEFLYPSDA